MSEREPAQYWNLNRNCYQKSFVRSLKKSICNERVRKRHIWTWIETYFFFPLPMQHSIFDRTAVEKAFPISPRYISMPHLTLPSAFLISTFDTAIIWDCPFLYFSPLFSLSRWCPFRFLIQPLFVTADWVGKKASLASEKPSKHEIQKSWTF